MHASAALRSVIPGFTLRRAHATLRRLRGAALALPLVFLAACTVRIGPNMTGPEPGRGPEGREERRRMRYEVPREERVREERDRGEAGRDIAHIAPGAALAIPVRGVRPEQLRDSFDDPRSGGRVHRAIDIMAPRGTPVVAAADGTVYRLRQGGLGGITIYQLGADGRTLYYYAHLERYAAGIREGTPVRRGEVIAYVGDTGNAGAGNYHLHFSVSVMTDPARWWDGDNVNPYPLLAGETARQTSGGR